MNRHLFTATMALGSLSPLGPAMDEDSDRVATVEKGAFKVTLDFEGVFDESDPVVLGYRPEASTGAVAVIEAVTPGPIEKGQVLVRFRSDGLDHRIRQAEIDLLAARSHLQRLTEESRRAEEARRLRLLRADLEVADAQRELDRMLTIDAPQRLGRSADQVRDWDVMRRKREEEFQILVRMYEADGVIETAERIDMESQKRRLARALLARPGMIARHEILKEITLPREVAVLEFGLRKVKHARDLLQATSSAQVEQKAHELAKSALGVLRQEEQLAKLRRDRKALTIKAPVDGFAMAGHYRGHWMALEEAARRLRPGARISPGEVLFTIVQSAPKVVRSSIPEELLFVIREDQEATLVPTAVPQLSLPATVTRIARYSTDGKFQMWLHVRTRHERLFPGNTCRVRITVRDRPEALTVPVDSIHHRHGAAYVNVWKNETATPRSVKVGLTSGNRTEILAGLEAGEKVLLEPVD